MECSSPLPADPMDSAMLVSPETILLRLPPILRSFALVAAADIMQQSVFFFGNGAAEGTREMKDVLGGKGANLAEMTNLGVPVPPGFTIACAECIAYLRHGKSSDRLRAEVEGNVARLEEATGKKLGDPKNPLLVSLGSGEAVSMPGMMETILNLGLNDRSVVGLAEQSKNPRF